MHFPERTAVDLDLLHSFVSVVDAGGFTRAGERVHRTQSTVSQQIRKLEDALGCALFIREGRGVRLTEDGERLLGYARRMLALSNEIREVVSGERRLEVVRLGLPDDLAVTRLTHMVADFARRHPQVRLSMRCDLSANLHRAQARGELDLVLLKREPGGVARAPALAVRGRRPRHAARPDCPGRVPAGLPVPQPRHPCAGERRPALAHRIRKSQPVRAAGGGGGRIGRGLAGAALSDTRDGALRRLAAAPGAQRAGAVHERYGLAGGARTGPPDHGLLWGR